ncbi:MAG: OmpA family protein [Fimbriimonadaceae bacterium]|nr:OmpA family protein [Fimbriimonadaceae bacterium]
MNDGTPIIIKKKKVVGHGHHGGAWKVAYADFVTAMMAFFLVMWIMGLSPEDRKIVQGYFNDPMGFMKSMPKGSPNVAPSGGRQSVAPSSTSSGRRAKKEEAELETIKKDIKSAIGSGQGDKQVLTLIKAIEVNVTPEGLELDFVEGKGVVFFELGSAVVRPQARAIIARVAVQLREAGRAMYVDGHTDGRPFSSGIRDNKLLSIERASSVYEILRANGVSEKQVLAVRGRGDRKLKYVDDPYDPRNRRVSIFLPYIGAEEKVMDDVQAGPEEQARFSPKIDLRQPTP